MKPSATLSDVERGEGEEKGEAIGKSRRVSPRVRYPPRVRCLRIQVKGLNVSLIELWMRYGVPEVLKGGVCCWFVWL